MPTRLVCIIAMVFFSNSLIAETLATAVSDCMTIEDPQLRLECFEAVAAVDGNQKQKPTERDKYISKYDVFGMGRDESTNSMKATIVRVNDLPLGRIEVVLDNQQVWRELEPGRPPHFDVGEKVTLRRTVFGGFRIRSDVRGYTRSVKRVM